jgi:hypothetical protein
MGLDTFWAIFGLKLAKFLGDFFHKLKLAIFFVIVKKLRA